MTYFCLIENGCVCYPSRIISVYLLSTGEIEMAAFDEDTLQIRLRVSQGYSRLKG